MKLKLTPLYVLSFLCLTFFIHEIHDWAHTLVVRLLSGSWGSRRFDIWQFDTDQPVSNGQRALAMLAGPAVNILVILVGWIKMGNRESLTDQSIGCSLVLAAMPLALLMGAATGGGDSVNGLKLFFLHLDATGRHLVSGFGLLILIIICVPPLVRVYTLLPGWQGKFIFFPIFLVLPMWIDHFLVADLLNRMLTKYEIDEGQAFTWVLLWTAAMLSGWLFTRRKMRSLLEDRELPL
ncbi:hypothetical protein [Puia dinghuensis]|uniref:Uncharacterized protein n=1 Tax=Puia dinghuensis TaxID=1792502 RepID=A0A8J2XUE0_9BACT|nr:hypothetical protein [Puia dinghuensis]GGB10948.1 hypothetical protein GCM10011511_38160 [Puia dinghuensis]